MYEEILGTKCRHALKRDGFGASSLGVFLGGVHSDGVFAERRLYQPRIDAIASLYCAFRNVPNQSLAKMTCARIDSSLPVSQQDRLQEVQRIQEMRKSGAISDQELEKYYPEAFPMYRGVEQLNAFAVRLKGVRSEGEWTALLDDPRWRPEAQTQSE